MEGRWRGGGGEVSPRRSWSFTPTPLGLELHVQAARLVNVRGRQSDRAGIKERLSMDEYFMVKL